jgi:hypothetical protein|tara:strand:- start:462 stop:794 length:333 start_codon:yes stop_codon:yes gene_type:complete
MDDKQNVWVINKVNNKEDKTQINNKDNKIQNIYDAKIERERVKRHEKFKRWLEKGSENTKMNDILNNLCRDVQEIVTNTGFTISNEKILRDEIATFIYKESYPDAQENYF